MIIKILLIIPAHWRTAAPSLYGLFGDPKQCPDRSAIYRFRTRARSSALGIVQIRGIERGTYGALTGVEFQCTNIVDAKRGKPETIDTMSFSVMDGTR